MVFNVRTRLSRICLTRAMRSMPSTGWAMDVVTRFSAKN